MPTADDFETAAAALDRLASQTEGLGPPLRAAAGAEVLRGGRLAADLEQFLEDAVRSCSAVAGATSDLAEECRRRAEVCRVAEFEAAAHHTALARHRRAGAEWQLAITEHELGSSTAEPGPPPRAPRPPATPPPWVELRR